MTLRTARKILHSIDLGVIQTEGDLYYVDTREKGDVTYLRWEKSWATVALEGAYTPDQLEAIALWMRKNYTPKEA